MGSGSQYWYDAVADHASRDFATGGACGVAAAVEQLYQPGKRYVAGRDNPVPELFRQAQLITSRTLEVFTMYLAASLIYWIMATVLSTLQNHFENQLNRQEREPK